MYLKAEHERLSALVIEALSVLCRNSLTFKSSLSIEGLLGITLDKDNIFLISVKEAFSTENHTGNEEVTLETVTDIGEAAKNIEKSNVVSLESDGGLGKEEQIDCETMQLSVNELHSSLAVSKYSDLDILLTSTDPSRSKSSHHADLVVDPSGTLFNAEELEQIMNASKLTDTRDPNTDIHHLSDPSDIAIVKEENLVKSGKERKQASPDSESMGMETVTASSNADEIMQLSKGDDVPIPGCSSWEDSFVDPTPLNLSEAHDPPEPQDLSSPTKKKKEGKHECLLCGKLHRNLKKHRCTEEPVGGLVEELAEPLNLISKPLDLTVARPDTGDEAEQEISDSELTIADQESFRCICGKSLSDYETYIDHIASCNKSKLTPYKSCEICGKFFFSSSGYLKHKRLHIGAYKFRCKICHKGFFDKTHLGAHMDSSHSKVRRFHCIVCKKSFFWKHHLKRHVVLHTPSERQGVAADKSAQEDG